MKEEDSFEGCGGYHIELVVTSPYVICVMPSVREKSYLSIQFASGVTRLYKSCCGRELFVVCESTNKHDFIVFKKPET